MDGEGLLALLGLVDIYVSENRQWTWFECKRGL